jgi:hypothetical protein
VVTLHAWDSGYADAACAGADAVAIDDLRARYLRQPSTRTWHYAVFARHAVCPDAEHCARCPADILSGGLPTAGSTGAAELMGSNFVVAAANLDAPRPIAQEAAAFMHGLGHNFGLHHGGDDATNLKPNYVSVMNGAYQAMGIPVARRTGTNEPRACRADSDCGWRAHCLEGGLCARIDYSAEKLPSLYEGALDKLAGVGGRPGDTDIVFHFVAGEERLAPVAGLIDWNGDARFGAGVVDADINNDGYQEVIGGFDDWAACAGAPGDRGIREGDGAGRRGDRPLRPAALEHRPDLHLEVLHARLLVGVDEALRVLHRLLLRGELEDREPADQLLGLGERAIDHLAAALGHADARGCRLQALREQQLARRARLGRELPDRRHQGGAGRLARLVVVVAHHQHQKLHFSGLLYWGMPR